MALSQTAFTAEAYTPRAQDYVASAVHGAGADLDQIGAFLQGRATARVLDLGCGGGHVSYRAAPHVASVTAVDPAAAMLDAVRRTAAERGLANIRVQQAAAEALPFGPGSFDVVLCRYTAHHWPDVPAGLGEARRVLTPEGRGVLVDSVAPEDRVLDTHLQAVELLRDPSHVRNYSVAEWTDMLAKAGFTVDDVIVRRVRMDFPAWTARTRTPAGHMAAIRSLQDGAPPAVRAHLAIGPDGSFDLDVATMVLHR